MTSAACDAPLLMVAGGGEDGKQERVVFGCWVGESKQRVRRQNCWDNFITSRGSRFKPQSARWHKLLLEMPSSSASGHVLFAGGVKPSPASLNKHQPTPARALWPCGGNHSSHNPSAFHARHPDWYCTARRLGFEERPFQRHFQVSGDG